MDKTACTVLPEMRKGGWRLQSNEVGAAVQPCHACLGGGNAAAVCCRACRRQIPPALPVLFFFSFSALPAMPLVSTCLSPAPHAAAACFAQQPTSSSFMRAFCLFTKIPKCQNTANAKQQSKSKGAQEDAVERANPGTRKPRPSEVRAMRATPVSMQMPRANQSALREKRRSDAMPCAFTARGSAADTASGVNALMRVAHATMRHAAHG